MLLAPEPIILDYYNYPDLDQSPFEGVNVEVTHYTDGTTSTRKVVK